jgi:hypothetical protein
MVIAGEKIVVLIAGRKQTIKRRNRKGEGGGTGLNSAGSVLQLERRKGGRQGDGIQGGNVMKKEVVGSEGASQRSVKGKLQNCQKAKPNKQKNKNK